MRLIPKNRTGQFFKNLLPLFSGFRFTFTTNHRSSASLIAFGFSRVLYNLHISQHVFLTNWQNEIKQHILKYTPNANMADHSVVARDELHESEVSQSLMFCFDNASFVVDLFCFISLCLRVAVFLPMRRERIEIFHRSPLRENSGSMQFLDTKKRSSRSPRDTPRGMFQDRRPQKNCLNDELMWCLVVFQYDFHGQQLSHQVKEMLFLKDILCLKAGSYLRSRPLARNRTKQILPCNNQANEL